MRKKEKVLKIKNVTERTLSTSTKDDGKNEWFKIEINFLPINYEVNKLGVIRNISTKEIIKQSTINKYKMAVLFESDKKYRQVCY